MNEREIFLEALEMVTPEARAAYLQGACGRDVALRRKIDELLKEHFANDSLLAGPIVEECTPTLLLPPQAEAPAQMLGRYKLLEKIGEGGFGEVWMAEQRQPVKRRVALKIIKLGMDSRQIVARFEAERQALAMMDHPNIAKIFDAGTTDGGRPYFVMELVRGIKITEYCDQNKLPTKERLGLFIKVCQAIQHAHQKGIIHRDIKPSNILVTLHDGVPVPKVIDFGIAKATQQELTDKTVFTQFQQFIGTPAYISPEQAEMSGLDIDTRSDIYSLGVLLYELLVGQTPFDAKEIMKDGLEALVRIIREREPMRPSTKLNTLPGAAKTTAGKRRHTDVGKLVHQLQGDLDWIVMKCLEKDRTRRYETANGLAMDIRRHLNNEPVVARPPSRLYAFQKIVRRHKLIFVMMSVVMLSLLLGVIGISIEFQKSEKHRRLAEAAQVRAHENFEQARAAVGDLLAVSDEDLYEKPGMQPLRVKLMRAALDRYQPFLKQPAADSALRAELGRLYLRYGFNAKAIGADYHSVVIPAYDSALSIQQQLVREHPENRTFRADLGWTMVCSKLWYDDTSGLKIYQPQAIAIFEELVRENPADPFARLGLVWALGLDVAGVLPDDPDKTAKSERRLVLLEQLVQEYPLSAEFRRDLANQLAWYPRAGEKPSDYAAELARVFRANELRAAVAAGLEQNDPAVLLPSYPKDSEAKVLRPSLLWAKIDLAYGWQRQSELLAKLQRWPEAVSLANRSAAMHRDLLEQNPSVKVLATMLDSAFTNRIYVTELSGDVAGAQAHRREAEDFWRTHPSLNRMGK